MISTNLHWIQTRTPGKLAISARPRGGDWLESELFGWRSLGIDVLVSLLESSEERELDLAPEADLARGIGVDFISFPIPDRSIPSTSSNAFRLVDQLKMQLESGRSIVIHCRQGVGRAGMIAASILTALGIEPEDAIEATSFARGITVPETPEQQEWIRSVLAHRD